MAESQGLYTQQKDETGLTKRQREVKRLVCDEGKTQMEVAEELGVSRQRVRQIVETLIAKGIVVPGAKSPEYGKFAQT